MTQPHILVHHISFHLPTGRAIFNKLNLAFSQKKIGLVGKNGVGKSTLLNLILGKLPASTGSLDIKGTLVDIPQNPFFSEHTTVVDFLGFATPLNALKRITEGSIDEDDFTALNNQWDITEHIQRCLGLFDLQSIPLDQRITTLSGGELTRLLLAKAFSSNADFLLLDEPTNHLDQSARQRLYNAIQHWQGGLIIASHDRTLLNLMEEIIELNTLSACSYGGNYDAYETQKITEQFAREQRLHDAKKSMQAAQYTIQDSREKHEKKQSYGREQKRSKRIDKLTANSKKGRSEKTQSKLLIKKEKILKQGEQQLLIAKKNIEMTEEINIDLPETYVPNGKIIIDIKNLYFSYSNKKIVQNFSLHIEGAKRIALSGNNGSGKTTLIKLILSELQPESGSLFIGTERVRYVDQNAALLNPSQSILENFSRLNPDSKENHAHYCLAQFLFKNTSALKLVKELSGGEKLRALLACVLMSNHPPQLLILDEPTNHLNLVSIKRIESALAHYQGALIAISHDPVFLKHIGVKESIRIDGK